jgi:hypothetical protein
LTTEAPEMQKNQLEQNIYERSTWVRGLYMILFLVIYNVAEIVTWVVALIQFGLKLFTGKPNEQLLVFGQGLSLFIYQVWRFLTFNSEQLPFPFTPWPDDESIIRDNEKTG